MGDSVVVQQWSSYHEELKSLIKDLIGQTRDVQRSCNDLPTIQQKLMLVENDLNHLKSVCSKNEVDFGARIKEMETKCDIRGCKMNDHELANQSKCIQMRDEVRDHIKNVEKGIDSKIEELEEAVSRIHVKLAYAGGIGAIVGSMGMVLLKLLIDIIHKHISGGQ